MVDENESDKKDSPKTQAAKPVQKKTNAMSKDQPKKMMNDKEAESAIAEFMEK